jgi:hypothetical protein
MDEISNDLNSKEKKSILGNGSEQTMAKLMVTQTFVVVLLILCLGRLWLVAIKKE